MLSRAALLLGLVALSVDDAIALVKPRPALSALRIDSNGNLQITGEAEILIHLPADFRPGEVTAEGVSQRCRESVESADYGTRTVLCLSTDELWRRYGAPVEEAP